MRNITLLWERINLSSHYVTLPTIGIIKGPEKKLCQNLRQKTNIPAITQSSDSVRCYIFYDCAKLATDHVVTANAAARQSRAIPCEIESAVEYGPAQYNPTRQSPLVIWRSLFQIDCALVSRN